MPDMEKVIKGIESCEPSISKRVCKNCPYREEMNCDYVLWNDALALLKEQEAVEPQEAYFDVYKSGGMFHCGHCKELIVKNQKYCHNCGKKVKWDDGF